MPGKDTAERTRSTCPSCATASDKQHGASTAIYDGVATRVLINATGNVSTAIPANDAGDANATAHADIHNVDPSNAADVAYDDIDDATTTNGKRGHAGMFYVTGRGSQQQ